LGFVGVAMSDEFIKARDAYISEFDQQTLIDTFNELLEESAGDHKTLVMLAFGQGLKLGSNWAKEWLEKQYNSELMEHANVGVMIGIEQANDKIRAQQKEIDRLVKAVADHVTARQKQQTVIEKLKEALEGYAVVPGKSNKPAKQALADVKEMQND
jgi:hypothetical protein